MKIYIGRPPKPGEPERFTIGQSVATPTDKQLKKMGFEKPLRKLAKMLKSQFKAYGKNEVIGIEVGGICFNFLLGPDQGEKKAE